METNGVNSSNIVQNLGVNAGEIYVKKDDIAIELFDGKFPKNLDSLSKIIKGDDPFTPTSMIPDRADYKSKYTDPTLLVLYAESPWDNPDSVYTDEKGRKCEVYNNDDGTKLVRVHEKGLLFGLIPGKTSVEKYDQDGTLMAVQKDGSIYEYDKEGNIKKVTTKNKTTMYGKDGEIKATREKEYTPNGEHVVTRYYNKDDGSYTEEVEFKTYTFSGSHTQTKYRTYDKNGSPLSPSYDNKEDYEKNEKRQASVTN